MTSNVVNIESARNAAYDKATFDLDAYAEIARLADDRSADTLRIASVDAEIRTLSDDAALSLLDTLADVMSRRFMQRLYSELSA